MMMPKTEREELQRLVRQREKVLKSRREVSMTLGDGQIPNWR